MPELTCIVVTPEATVLEETTQFVALPLYDGEIGIAPHHAPMIGRLGYGELRLRSDDGGVRLYIDGGFVQIADNVVSVLTNRALPVDNLDEAQARELLESAAKTKANTDELFESRDKSIAQARAQIRIAQRVQK